METFLIDFRNRNYRKNIQMQAAYKDLNITNHQKSEKFLGTKFILMYKFIYTEHIKHFLKNNKVSSLLTKVT